MKREMWREVVAVKYGIYKEVLNVWKEHQLKMNLEWSRYLLNELYIKIGLQNIYYTNHPTRNDTKFTDPPAQISHLKHP